MINLDLIVLLISVYGDKNKEGNVLKGRNWVFFNDDCGVLVVVWGTL